MKVIFLILILLTSMCQVICAQTARKAASSQGDTAVGPGAGTFIPSLSRSGCKQVLYLFRPGGFNNVDDNVRHKGDKGSAHKKPPLLKIHGNILYDLNYWSNIDTPYAEKNVYQHTVQTYLDITYKDNYPFRIYLTNSWSNSPLIHKFTDLNAQYNTNDFRQKIKMQALALLQQGWKNDSLQQLEKKMLETKKEYAKLQNWLSDPSQLQSIISQREQKWLKARRDSLMAIGRDSSKSWIPDAYKKDGDDGGSSGSLSMRSVQKKEQQLKTDDSLLQARYDSARRRLDSLSARLDKLEKLYQQLQSKRVQNLDDAKKDLENSSSGSEVHDKLAAAGISDSSLPKGYKTLYSVRNFGIGRTMLNFSELSAKNISINGVLVEYNPSYYAAFAAGTIDYRFRDYTLSSPVKGQYLALGRYGWGKKDGNGIILTYYTGKRQLYNASTTVQGTDIPNYSLMGFTVEGHYKLNKNLTFIGEVAKSSLPYYSLDSSEPHSVFSSAVKLSDHSAEAWSLKLNSAFPKTHTNVVATYSHYGANFQSFSFFSTGTDQKAWSIKAEQPFIHQHLQVTAGIKTNDFSNPLLASSYKSTTLFESLQATWRMKKFPTISVGYFPSSQLIKLSDGQFQENLFNTLTASVTHSYSHKGVSMMSMLIYTQFYNRTSDSGFVYYNARNLLVNQSFFWKKFSLQAQGSAAYTPAYNLYTLENKVDYRLNSWLALGAGVKYNYQTVYDIRQWGYSGNASIVVPKIGSFRMSGDKGFIPGSNKQLVPNNQGRLTYIKVF